MMVSKEDKIILGGAAVFGAAHGLRMIGEVAGGNKDYFAAWAAEHPFGSAAIIVSGGVLALKLLRKA